MDRLLNRSIVTGLVILLWAVAAGGAGAQTVTAVPKLDTTRFSGVWYEIARYPMKREKRCVGNAQMLFALGDKPNHVQMVNSCKTKAGYSDASNVDGKAQDKSGDGKLKLGSIWPFYRKYWVLATEPDYMWSLVGSPNRKDLWIYSRSATLPPETLAEIRSKAASQGFAPEKLITLPHGLE